MSIILDITMNRNNWLSSKPSTKVQYAPGGGSSFSLGWSPQTQQPANATQGQCQQSKATKLCGRDDSKRFQTQRLTRGLQVQQPSNPAQTPIPQQLQNTLGYQPVKAQPVTVTAAQNNHATSVRNFTRACGQSIPNTPQLMNCSEVQFITKMVLDELLELNASVMNPLEAKNSIVNMLQIAKHCPRMNTQNKAEIIAKQVRALVDIWYGSLECAAKKGINLSSVFDLVHAANMRKVDSATGMCVRRADGKIEKPVGWTPPNIADEMQRQALKGSFS